MIKYIKYTIAYISLCILWLYLTAILLNIFEVINFNRGGVFGTAIIAFVFGYIYHKFKPMEFKELSKFIKKKLTN
ncbi:hypothetical protein [Arcobacter sp. YIC-310]|uniref:hypothetical protein n=1 Tax=Arcobacter sp. YIC-310 TaxID=3376632 RepID=UPI003C26FC0C